MDTKIDFFQSDDLERDSASLFEDGSMGTIGDNEKDSRTEEKIKEEKHPVKDGGSFLGFLSVEYYQPYFDVTTSDVFYRVFAGLSPFPFKLADVLSSNPDMYGPFWLCMTLIFAIAISGNISAFISGNTQWQFHFHEVIIIATVVYIYTWSVPIILWLILVWRNATDRYSLVKMQSIYGYSMTVFIPLTLLWVINVEILRWLLLAIALALSGAVLVQALWTPLKDETKNMAIAILTIVFMLHSGIAIGFKFYYFGSSLAPAITTKVPITVALTDVPSIASTKLTTVKPTVEKMNKTQPTVSRNDALSKTNGHEVEGGPTISTMQDGMNNNVPQVVTKPFVEQNTHEQSPPAAPNPLGEASPQLNNADVSDTSNNNANYGAETMSNVVSPDTFPNSLLNSVPKDE